jgi:hypothetical protein
VQLPGWPGCAFGSQLTNRRGPALDSLDFCWIAAAARQRGTGLMATKVPF